MSVKSELIELNEDSAFILFTIKDTGIGLTEEQSSKLFNEFEQGDNSISRKFGGTGLGLAISKKLIELMEGEVGVNSELGKGSTFWFTARIKKAEPNNTDIASIQQTISIEQIAGAKVLLVDDVEINLEVAAGLLSNAGMMVDVASNGLEAVAMVSATRYDLVLMDMQMPVMNGLDATRKIRAESSGEFKLPIVAMTANATLEDQQRCFVAGMDDFITKPISPEQLNQLLVKWIPVTVRTLITQPSISTSVQDNDHVDFPPKIMGIDVQDGLARVLGKKKLFLEMLGKFAETHKTIVRDIYVALDAGDLIAAKNIAHTIKGVASNISAFAIQNQSELLENAIKNEQTLLEIVALLPPLEDKINSLIVEIENLSYFKNKSIAAEPIDLTQIEPVCDNLIRYLAAFDAVVYDEFSRNEELLRICLPATFPQLKESIQSFDFETALRVLKNSVVTLKQ